MSMNSGQNEGEISSSGNVASVIDPPLAFDPVRLGRVYNIEALGDCDIEGSPLLVASEVRWILRGHDLEPP